MIIRVSIYISNPTQIYPIVVRLLLQNSTINKSLVYTVVEKEWTTTLIRKSCATVGSISDTQPWLDDSIFVPLLLTDQCGNTNEDPGLEVPTQCHVNTSIRHHRLVAKISEVTLSSHFNSFAYSNCPSSYYCLDIQYLVSKWHLFLLLLETLFFNLATVAMFYRSTIMYVMSKSSYLWEYFSVRIGKHETLC